MTHTHHAAYMQPHIHSYIAHVCAYGAVLIVHHRCTIYSYGAPLAKKLRNADGMGVEEEEELPGVAGPPGPPGVARGARLACWASIMAIKAAAASTFVSAMANLTAIALSAGAGGVGVALLLSSATRFSEMLGLRLGGVRVGAGVGVPCSNGLLIAHHGPGAHSPPSGVLSPAEAWTQR